MNKENKRVDLTHLPFITIDGAETKDIDDAVYIKKHRKGYDLYVAIADVSYFVKPGSELDTQAKIKTSTEYLLGQTKHMFPDELSQDACSLIKQQEKLVAVCHMKFDLNGNKTSYKFFKGIINSRDEVNYDRVNKLLKKQEEFTSFDKSYNLKKLLLDAADLSWKLKILRDKTENNKSSFGNEPKYKLNEDYTKIIKIIPNYRGIAEKMIENFMIQANLSAGDFIYKKTKNGIVRKHEKLVDANYESIQKKAKNRYDIDVSKSDILNDFNQFENSMQKQLRIILLEEYKNAVYTNDMQDNFHEGLTVKNYTHFTSPIRRYSDILAHRLIFGEIDSLEHENVEIISEKINSDTGEVDKIIKTIPITTYISEKSIEIKKSEKKHLRNMLNVYYKEYWSNRKRNGKVVSDFYKNKIVKDNITGEEVVKEVYAGSFIRFFEGDEVKVMLPPKLRKIDTRVNVSFIKDEIFSKKIGKDCFEWKLTPRKRTRK